MSESLTTVEGTEDKIWYPVPGLYQRLYMVQDGDQVADEVIAELNVTQEDYTRRISRNIRRLHSQMAANTIGISSVTINRATIETEKVYVLFRRLNDGGTRLSALDLMASVFKAFDYKMERFFRTVVFEDMRLYQDEIIKLIFILQNQPTKRSNSSYSK
ncbi:MAG: hypothetical protein R3E31_27255 [Chloroflexota bacterium]